LNSAYLAALALLGPWIAWQSLRTGKYREGYRQKLLGLVPRRGGDATCLWIHAVSVGEVNLLATLLKDLRAAHPDWQFVVSTTSRAGFELALKKYSDLSVFYCPLDFSWAVRNAMRRIRPALLVLAELELWPNLIAAAKEHGAAVAIINGRLSDKSYPGYRRIRPLAAGVLRQVDLIAAQDLQSAERFRSLGAPAGRVHVTGSLKYDGAETSRDNSRTVALRRLARIAEDDLVFLAGSTQEPEEQYGIEIYRRLSPQFPQLRLILVPRHPERFDSVARLLDTCGLSWVRRSQLTDRTLLPSAGCAPVKPILLVDSIGELAAWWGTAQIAFVGGSFGARGGQNMIEPAAYGAAVSFGPNTRNFRDIVAALEAADAAKVVHNAQELEHFVHHCLVEPQYAVDLGRRAQAFVRGQLGATARTLALVNNVLNSSATSTHRDAA
jgi:3-deoxy-D-manno-octulosonic-acid transferase